VRVAALKCISAAAASQPQRLDALFATAYPLVLSRLTDREVLVKVWSGGGGMMRQLEALTVVKEFFKQAASSADRAAESGATGGVEAYFNKVQPERFVKAVAVTRARDARTLERRFETAVAFVRAFSAHASPFIPPLLTLAAAALKVPPPPSPV
jgi:hypothetical protein